MLRRIASKIYNSSPRELLAHFVKKRETLSITPSDKSKAKLIEDRLRNAFDIYKTKNLRTISAEDFAAYIHSKIDTIDFKSEGYTEDELDRQRDLSIKYHWGHNHDFGEFEIKGRMRDRHINLLVNFVTFFPVSLQDFENKEVFDVGCWTGGTTLLLAAIGSRVFAIEEVKKYSETVAFLAKAFDIEDRIKVEPLSIYSCNSASFHNRFDIVYVPGVIYHLSDPLIALRILFNSLKVDGMILVESEGIKVEQPFCRFDGSMIYKNGEKERLNRAGWNWFIPSPSALYRLMREAGFEEIETQWHHSTNRIYVYAKKVAQVGICKAGLSVPDIL